MKKVLVPGLLILLFGIIPNLSWIQDPLLFNYPKQALINLISFIILLILGWKFLSSNIKEVKITSSVVLLFIWFLLMLISTLTSQSHYFSVFGDWSGPSREGLLTSFGFLIFFLFFRTVANLEIIPKILFVITLGSCYMFLWGIVNESGLDYFQNLPIRMSSLEQNTIDFSNYQTLALPASLALFLAFKDIRLKILSFLALAATFSAIVLSLTRGAWISTILTILILGSLIWHLKLIWVAQLKKYFLVLGILLLVGFLYTLPILKSRISETFSFSIYSSPVVRSLEYQAGLKIIRDHPLLGVGPAALRIVFPQYRPIELNLNLKEWNQATSVIRSYYLQIAATVGILNLVAFIAFITYIFKSSFQVFKKAPQTQFIFLIGLFGVWLAIVISFIFYHASLTQQLFFWCLSGFLAGMAKEKTLTSLKLPNWTLPIVLTLTAIILILGLTIDFISKIYFAKRVYLPDRDQRLETIATAIRLNPFDNSYNYHFVLEYLPKMTQTIAFRPDEQTLVQGWINDATKKLELAKKLNPKDPKLIYAQSLLSLQSIRLAKGEEKEKLFPKVLEDAKMALDANPTYPEAADVITLVYLAKDGKKLKEAEESARYSIKLMPGYIIGHHHLGEALKQQGRFQEAIEAYELSFEYEIDNEVSKVEIEKIKKIRF